MEKTTVYLTSRQKEALARAARAELKSEAELIREGVDLITARHRVAEPTLPLFESGQPDLAERVDELRRGFGETFRLQRRHVRSDGVVHRHLRLTFLRGRGAAPRQAQGTGPTSRP